MILVVCPWCHAVVKERASKKEESSYSICGGCREQMLKDIPVAEDRVCPHNIPVGNHCLGCDATVGGNSGA